MKRGKGIAAWLMVLAMVLMMTACAGGTDETAQGQTETQAAETTQAGRRDRGGNGNGSSRSCR